MKVKSALVIILLLFSVGCNENDLREIEANKAKVLKANQEIVKFNIKQFSEGKIKQDTFISLQMKCRKINSTISKFTTEGVTVQNGKLINSDGLEVNYLDEITKIVSSFSEDEVLIEEEETRKKFQLFFSTIKTSINVIRNLLPAKGAKDGK